MAHPSSRSAPVDGQRHRPDGFLGAGDQGGIRVGELTRRQIVVARAFVAQRPVDRDEVGRRSDLRDLARRRDADEEAASRSEQLLRDQDSERGADGAPDNSGRPSFQVELEHLRVIASPTSAWPRRPGSPQVPDDIAVRVEDADGRYINERHSPLASSLA
jgi:hypothetical protein